MGSSASKAAAEPKIKALLDAAVVAAQDSNFSTTSQAPADDPRRDLATYKTADQKFLGEHPGNRIYNAFHIHHKRHYQPTERASMRDIHRSHYFKFGRQTRASIQSGSKVLDAVISAAGLGHPRQQDEQTIKQQSDHTRAVHSQSMAAADEIPMVLPGSSPHNPITMPERSRSLLVICGTAGGELVRCLLDTACQSQLCSTKFARAHLHTTCLDDEVYLTTYHEERLTRITECTHTSLDLGGHIEEMDFFVTNLPGYDIVLGLPWFETHNPAIDFAKRFLTFSPYCHEACLQDESIEVRGQVSQNGSTILQSPDKILSMMIQTTDGKSKDDDDFELRGESESGGDYEAEWDSGKRKGNKAGRVAKKRFKGITGKPGRIISTRVLPFDLRSRSPFDIDNAMSSHSIKLEGTSPHFQCFYAAVKKHGLKQRQGLSTLPYTPRPTQAQHVLDLNEWKPDERLYELVVADVNLVPHTQPDGSTTHRWRMLARNIADPMSEDVELFLLPTLDIDREKCSRCRDPQFGKSGTKCTRDGPGACRQCLKDGEDQACLREYGVRQQQFAVMTEDVCKDKPRIIALGRIAVDIMNKAPFDLKLDSWKSYKCPKKGGNRSNIVSREQCFVDCVSFVEWKKEHWKDFDLSTLPQLPNDWRLGWRGSPWSNAWYGEPLATISKGKAVGSFRNFRFPTIFVTKDWRTDVGALWLQSSLLNNEVVDKAKLPDESYHIFGKPTPKSEARADKIQRICAYDLVGYVGNVQNIRDAHEDCKTRFLKDKSHVHAGPYNGNQFLNVLTRGGSTGQWSLLIPDTVFEDLEADGGERVKHRVLDPWIALSTNDQECIAWVLQKTLDSLAKGHGLIEVLFNAYSAVEQLASGTMTRTKALNSYCLCDNTPDTVDVIQHHCMQCKSIRNCANMVKQDTADGTLIRCVGCGGRDFQRRRGDRPFEHKMTAAARCIFSEESKVHTPPFSRFDLEQVARDHHSGSEPDSYICGYTGRQKSVRAAVWPPELRWCGIAHPETPSMERPFLRYRRPDMRLVLHDPEYNLTITATALNIMKGGSPPACLPLLKKAVQLKARIEGRKPVIGYHDDVKLEWEILERAMDHERIIETLSARANKYRLQEDVSRVSDFVKMEKSGVWDCKSLRTTNALFDLPRGGYKNIRAFNDRYWDWTVILDAIKQMESDPDLNPHGFHIPRLGKHQIPWFWRPDLCTVDSDYDADFVYDIFSRRYHVMREKCNVRYETQESPATLLLEYAAQWLESGGKCHFFGCMMIPFAGHLETFSFGRGVVQFRGQEQGGDRLIQAGEPMFTGCKVLLPTNMAKEYDKSRRTVIVETWKANRLRFCYPNYVGLVDMLERIVLDVQDSCKWYDPMDSSLEHYPKVPLPTKKDQKEYLAKMLSFASICVKQDKDEEPPVDDEEEYYAEALKEFEGTGGQRKFCQNRHQELKILAQSLGCEDYNDIKKPLEELLGLLDSDSPDALHRCDALISELEESLQRIAHSGSEDALKLLTAGNGDGGGSGGSRLDLFRYHLEEMKQINFLPKPLREVVMAINSRIVKDEEMFERKEAIDLLDQLDDGEGGGGFSIVVGLSG